VLCALCVASLRPVSPPWCERCGAPTAWPVERCRECTGRRLAFASARAAVLYAGPARTLLRGWKERGVRRAAELAAEVVATRLEPPLADVITAIPPDPVRQLRRGRHPAVELAGALGCRWGIECATLLRRAAAGRRQTGLTRIARGDNVRGAFRASGDVRGSVLLIDDVYTTGATASTAARALLHAGAASVAVVTFARTPRPF
jgi:predicted amidophosphoribosyltransferase